MQVVATGAAHPAFDVLWCKRYRKYSYGFLSSNSLLALNSELRAFSNIPQ